MAINIGENENSQVTYTNQPDVSRVLFKNLPEGVSPEEIVNAVNDWLDEHPEATTTIEDGSILPVKINSTNSASDGYVLAYNATESKFEWVDVQSDLTSLKNGFNQTIITEKSKNLWNPDTTVGGQLDINNGTVGGSTSLYVTSDYIPFVTGEAIYEYWLTVSTGDLKPVTPSIGNANSICFYDANKTFIMGIAAGGWTIPHTITTENVGYIRVSFAKAHFTNPDRIYGVFKTTQTVDSFEPYYAPKKSLNPDIMVSGLENNDYSLIAYGDSLTTGAGSTGLDNRYIDKCGQELDAKNWVAFGYAGSGSKSIAWTAGALSAYIPPNANSFSLKYADFTSDVTIYNNGLNGKTVIIGDEEHTISQSGPTSYSLPSEYTPRNMYVPCVVKDSRFTADIYIIWVGTNNSGYAWDILDAMVAKLPHKKYVIMGLTRFGTDTSIEDEKTCYEKYGSHFFNTRMQIIENAFKVLNITPTSEDTTAMSTGLMPPSLLSDTLHFNNDGYTAIGKLLAMHIKALGYAYQHTED